MTDHLVPAGTTDTPAARRVLLKLSGEVFGGGAIGLDADIVAGVAREIAEASRTGVEIAIVVGGGNFFRGAELSERGIDRSRADYMGMLGTVMNALALQDFLEQAGVRTRVQTAITMGQVAEPYIPLRAIRHLEKGRVVVFAAGAGMPYFSTDTVAAQRALETHCVEVLVGKNGVDGVYTADPRLEPDARLLRHVTYGDALQRGLRVVDAAAFSLCMDNGLNMRVFGMTTPGHVTRALLGDKIGTLVTVDGGPAVEAGPTDADQADVDETKEQR
ncbi:UMP kinase [Georgenia sunbinii]|uniref:UMP kinase n=1 Tax=Georgenia sunbinii TaxID=3117728 RepID=UPI002F25F13C